MKTYKKMIGKLVVATVAISTSFASISPQLVNATELNIGKNIISTEAKTTNEIKDINDFMEEAIGIYAKNVYEYDSYFKVFSKPGEYISHTSGFDLNYNKVWIEADGSPIFTDTENIYVGRSTLTNDFSIEQTLATQSFSKTISLSTTTSMTNGIKLGEKISAKFKIPLVAEATSEASIQYDFSKTDTQTNGESITYTVPSQNIKVPANSSAEVIVYLKTGKAKGNVNLVANMSGMFHTRFIYANANTNSGTSSDLSYLVKNSPKIPNLEACSDESVNIISSGKYEAEYGTSFSVTVRPIDNKGRAINQGYTFEVTPQISK